MRSLPETLKANGQKELSQEAIQRRGRQNGRELYNLIHGKETKKK